MIKINLICVGKIKEKYLLDGIEEYVKRLSKYAKVTIKELDDEKIPSKTSSSLDEQIKIKESNKILSLLSKDEYNILLDVYGKEIDSIKLSETLGKIIDEGNSVVNFIIAGSLGPSEELRNKVNLKISLSKLTFTHQMTRLILLEQIYRCFKINNNETYHK